MKLSQVKENFSKIFNKIFFHQSSSRKLSNTLKKHIFKQNRISSFNKRMCCALEYILILKGYSAYYRIYS